MLTMTLITIGAAIAPTLPAPAAKPRPIDRICPQDGKGSALVMPRFDTEAMIPRVADHDR